MAIDTGPTGKSAQAIAGAPISGMAGANAPLAMRGRAIGRMSGMGAQRRMAPPRGPRRPMGTGAVNKSMSGSAGAGIGPSPFQQMGYKGVNATGATGGGMSRFGQGGPIARNPGGPMMTQGDPLMEAGPVMESAPPMFQAPPPPGSNPWSGMGDETSMLMDQYRPQNRDPRFRY